MGETPETDHLLQLQLRAGELEKSKGVLRDCGYGIDPYRNSKQTRRIVSMRITNGCLRCRRPWSDQDLDKDLPAIGVSCHRCWTDSEQVLDDLGPFLDESRRRRIERHNTLKDQYLAKGDD